MGIAADGSYFLESDQGRLYFGKHEGTLYSYRVEGDDPDLRRLQLTLPRLPLVQRPHLEWHDYVPVSVATSGLRLSLARLGSFFLPGLNSLCVRQSFRGRHCVQSSVESKLLGLKQEALVKLDTQGWFMSAKVGDTELRRVATTDKEMEPRPSQAKTHQDKPDAPASASDTTHRMKALAGASGLSSRVGFLLSLALPLAGCVVAVVALTMTVRQGTDRDQWLKALDRSARHESAQNYRAAVDELLPQLPKHVDEYLLQVRLGWLYYLDGQFTKSVSHYQAAIAVAPEALEARLGCLLPLLAEGRYEVAAVMAQDLLERDPANYDARLRLAIALRLLKKPVEAQAILAPLQKAYPADAIVAAEQARLLAAFPAASAASRVPAATSAELTESLRRSVVYEQAGNYEAAINALSDQRLLHPENYVLNLRLGWLHSVRSELPKAAEFYQQAARAAPDSREPLLGQLTVLMAHQKYADAESTALRLLKDAPRHYRATLCLAVACRESGRLEDAHGRLVELQKLYPADVPIKTELAIIALRRHDTATSQRLFREVLAVSPENVTARQNIPHL